MTQLTLCEIMVGLLADTSPPVTLWIREGYDATKRGINALGENRHTIYLQSYLDFTLGKDPRELAIVSCTASTTPHSARSSTPTSAPTAG